MKVFKPIGSKERFAEIFQGVTKVNLNEGFGQSFNPQAVLDLSFTQLKNGQLNIVRSNSQAKGDQSYVELVCKDKQGNDIVFIFKVNAKGGDQDGVFNVNDVVMTSFAFDSTTNDESVEMDEKGLQQFNAKYGNELFDVIDKYIDVEEEQPVDSLYEDAIKKIDSYPFGGNPERMQTNAAYGDEKPINPIIRVKAPELNKFAPVNEIDQPAMKLKMQPMVKPTTVTEDMNSILHYSQAARDAGSKFKSKLSVTYQYVLVDALKEIGVNVRNIEDIDNAKYRITAEYQGEPRTFIINGAKFDSAMKVRELIKKALKIGVQETLYEADEVKMGDYPDPLGKKFKPKEHYPKKRKKPTSSVKLSENIEDDEVDEKSKEPEVGDDNVTDTEFMDTERKGLQGDGEEQISHQPMDNEPETNDEKPVHGLDPHASDVEKHLPNSDDGMSHEPDADEIEQIAQDKEEAGEMIPGGKGEGKSPLEFDPEQILMGMRVEMEHTDDPMVALEITLDHLTEDPEYYTTKDTPNDSAQANASADANSGEGDDKDMEDILLGFKPHNVGDEVPDTSRKPKFAEPEETSEEEPETTEPEKKENELDESVNNKINNLITEEQIKMAKLTLSNRNISTGMSKKEAVQILMNNNLKKIL